MKKEWVKRDLWHRRGHNYLVEVSRRTVPEDPDRGPNRWCVYVYIYAGHPDYRITRGDAGEYLPLHCGVSYYRQHDTSLQIGADYNHLHGGGYSYCAEAEEARQVFRDADQLFDVMEERNHATLRAG